MTNVDRMQEMFDRQARVERISNSESMCLAKWLQSTITLQTGMTHSCHHPPVHQIEESELRDNVGGLHNTDIKRHERQQMLNGERPTECDYCWKMEDMDRNAASDRIFKTVRYSDTDITKLAELPWDSDVPLQTLEIAFDRICNFACSYCNPSFSTVWGNDIAKNGEYTNLLSDGGGAYRQDGKWAEPYGKKNTDNPYIKAFWEWRPTLRETLQELRITGGEPTMSPHFWVLVERLRKGGARSDMNFTINSNLIMPPATLENLISASHDIPNFGLYTSCEAVGAQAEYLRDGLIYDEWYQNFIEIHRRGNFVSTNVMMTISALSLFSLPEFLDHILDIKRLFGWQSATISANVLRFPSFMSPLVLPDHLREDRRLALVAWLDKNGKSSLLKEMEIQGLSRLVDYLDVVKTPHNNTSERKTLHHDFKSFYSQYDVRRNKSFSDTFPSELVDWVDSIDE